MGLLHITTDDYSQACQTVAVLLRRHPSLSRRFEATDFVHEAAQRILDPRCQTIGTSAAVLIHVARLAMIDEIRRQHSLKRGRSRVQSLESLDESGHIVADPSIPPWAFAQAQETWERLIGVQNQQMRTILTMRRDGYSTEEIARRTGQNLRTVQRRLSRFIHSQACSW
jgi:RNA polymerase sigma factor (sigma-70 family)